MKNLFVIFGNQLFDPEKLKKHGCSDVFMSEDYGLCTYEKHHKLKIYLFLIHPYTLSWHIEINKFLIYGVFHKYITRNLQP